MRPLRIIVGLDSLLDTRLACIHMLNHEHVEPLLKNGYRTRYHNKLSLLYDKISDSHVEELFSSRDLPMLKVSRATNLVNLLSDRILESSKLGEKSPLSREVHIVLNTYPYNLTNELVRIYVEEFARIFRTTKITRIHLPSKELTPEYLKKNFSRLIVHNLDEWTEAQSENLKITPIPLFTVIAPGIINDPIAFANKIKEKHLEFNLVNATKYMEASLEHFKRQVSNLIELEFYQLCDFSLTLPNQSELKEEDDE